MNSPVESSFRQRNACLGVVPQFVFELPPIPANVDTEARPSNTRSVSNCQNRYPSPSGWSGSHPRARPLDPFVFGRSVADRRHVTFFILVSGGASHVLVCQGRHALQVGGKTSCRRNFPCCSSQPLSDWPGATKVAISSARQLARPSAVRRVRSTRMASASRVPPSVRRPARSQTTSDRAPSRVCHGLRRTAPASGRAVLFFSGCARPVKGEGQCSRRS